MPGTRHLFSVTRGLLRLATLFSLFLIVVLTVAMGGLALISAGIITIDLHMPQMPAGVAFGQVLSAAALALTGCILCVALVAWIFLLLASIIDTASQGDPFVSENADRLNRIALLMLAVQAVGLAFEIAMNLFPEAIQKDVSVGFGLSASGVLSALLIFVLAQIFRRGSEMRAELEGTV